MCIDLEKQMPIDYQTHILPEEIDLYNSFGQLGWKYIQERILVIRNFSLEDRIKFLHRFHQLKKYLSKYEPDR